MAAERASSSSQNYPHATSNTPSTSSHLRYRPLGRSTTFADVTTPLNRRRSSIFSVDSVSEARNSVRSSTDDLLLPRAKGTSHSIIEEDASHWQSAPLGLALLPALAGLFFKGGSAHITDATLLILAAIFLNWSVRLPWEWYRSAQAVVIRDPDDPYNTILKEDEEEEGDHVIVASPASETPPPPSRLQSAKPPKSTPSPPPRTPPRPPAVESASHELQRHELLALLSCFVLPVIAAWLLHHIRRQLTRPAEGLVSNYNLSIFLLSAEIRPISHLIKLVQARTLYLQRVVASSPFKHERVDSDKVLDLAKRLEELEGHVAENSSAAAHASVEASSARTATEVTTEVKKTLSPEIDALNRAVRRYEKRTTIQTIQTESRLQDLETRMKDAIALAAAAQRGVQGQRQRYAMVLLDWLCACVVVPLQTFWSVVSFPSKMANGAASKIRSVFGTKVKKERSVSRHGRLSRERDNKDRGSFGAGRGSKRLS